MGAVWSQLAVSFLFFPVLLWLIRTGISRGMRPLNQLAGELAYRRADHPGLLAETDIDELRPLVSALNGLFNRVEQAMLREKQFTADAAHELRSPLTALKVQLEILEIPHDQACLSQRLDMIRNNLDKIIRLTDQLLLLAKLDPLTSLLCEDAVDWQSVSNNAMQTVHYAAREKNIRLLRHLDAANGKDVFPMKGDSALLEAMLRNLLDNAVRYSPVGSTVTLIAGKNSIAVENMGQGVADSVLPLMRERFFRPPEQRESGNGLGLSVVVHIAELHGLVLLLENVKNPAGENIGFKAALQQYSRFS